MRVCDCSKYLVSQLLFAKHKTKESFFSTANISLAPVVQKVDNSIDRINHYSIQWIAQLISLLLIHWIVIYPADSHRLINWYLGPVSFSGVTIPFISQERRGFKYSNFTVIFLFVTFKAVGSFTNGFSGLTRNGPLVGT